MITEAIIPAILALTFAFCSGVSMSTAIHYQVQLGSYPKPILTRCILEAAAAVVSIAGVIVLLSKP
jgi:hypothetical protein